LAAVEVAGCVFLALLLGMVLGWRDGVHVHGRFGGGRLVDRLLLPALKTTRRGERRVLGCRGSDLHIGNCFLLWKDPARRSVRLDLGRRGADHFFGLAFLRVASAAPTGGHRCPSHCQGGLFFIVMLVDAIVQRVRRSWSCSGEYRRNQLVAAASPSAWYLRSKRDVLGRQCRRRAGDRHSMSRFGKNIRWFRERLLQQAPE